MRLAARDREAGRRREALRVLYQQGCRDQAGGRYAEAVRRFRAVAKAAPGFADAVQNLGVSLFALGRHAESAAAGAQLVRLRPADGGAHFNHGMALAACGEAEAAVAAFSTAVGRGSDNAKTHRALASALLSLGRKAEAAGALMRLHELEPAEPGLLVTVAALLIETGQLAAAAGASLVTLETEPENAEALSNLAAALHGLGDSRGALAPGMKAVELAPGHAGMATNLSAILLHLGLHRDALEAARRAVRLDPGSFMARSNASLALEALGRLPEAENEVRAAVGLAPDRAEARHNLAALLLGTGRLGPEAWEHYEARLRLPAVSAGIADLPRWRGEDIAGRTILLHAEQGFGDTLQFVRFVPLVKARGARVVLAVQAPLLRLLQHGTGADEVVAIGGGPLPAHDVFCPLLSLPLAFGTTLDSIPPAARFVPDPGAAEGWRLPPAPALRVGLAWAGNASFTHDKRRSMRLADLRPLASVPGIEFHSLQKDAGPPDPGFPLLDRMEGAADFADTAAIIAGLDLVIAVDTAVAHLAAGLGKPVWMLSRFLGCWRWLRDRTDSPWYPTLRLYRQAAPGDWAGVVQAVRRDLSGLGCRC